MTLMRENEIIDIIKSRLSEHRFRHSLAVAQVARELAQIFSADGDLAYQTGLLHDYAKGIAAPDLIAIAEQNGLITDKIDYELPDLLHAPVGAYLLQNELGIENLRMLEAVRVHTMGSLTMSDLDKIIFLADMIEPSRDYPGQQRLDCLARRDLDRAMLLGLDSTIRYCLEQARILHPRTIMVRNHFLVIAKNQGQLS